MRNILLASAAVALLATSAHATCAKSNWSVGLQTGGQWTKADIKKEDGTKVNKSTYGSVPIALTLDWTKSAANSWLYGFGVEAGYVAGNPSKKFDFSGTNYTAKMNPSWFGGLNARLGWDFGNKWALYGLVAARTQSTEFKISNTRTGAQLAKKRKSVFGAGVGAGADVNVTERLVFGVQYRYYWEQGVKLETAAPVTKYKAKLGSHNVLAKLSYKF